MALIKCNNCGKEVSTKASVCPVCGNMISKEEVFAEKNIVVCEECQTEYSYKESMCPNCGCPNSLLKNKDMKT